MGFKISPADVQILQAPKGGNPEAADQANKARSLLHGMAASLVTKSGDVKQGYLKLTSGDDGVTLGTRWSRSDNLETKGALASVRNLIQHAYGKNEAIDTAIDSYLAGKREGKSANHGEWQGLGTQSFVKLVKTLEAHYGAPDGFTDDLLAGTDLGSSGSIDTESLAGELQSQEQRRIDEQKRIEDESALLLQDSQHRLQEAAQKTRAEIAKLQTGLRHSLRRGYPEKAIGALAGLKAKGNFSATELATQLFQAYKAEGLLRQLSAKVLFDVSQHEELQMTAEDLADFSAKTFELMLDELGVDNQGRCKAAEGILNTFVRVSYAKDPEKATAIRESLQGKLIATSAQSEKLGPVNRQSTIFCAEGLSAILPTDLVTSRDLQGDFAKALSQRKQEWSAFLAQQSKENFFSIHRSAHEYVGRARQAFPSDFSWLNEKGDDVRSVVDKGINNVAEVQIKQETMPQFLENMARLDVALKLANHFRKSGIQQASVLNSMSTAQRGIVFDAARSAGTTLVGMDLRRDEVKKAQGCLITRLDVGYEATLHDCLIEAKSGANLQGCDLRGSEVTLNLWEEVNGTKEPFENLSRVFDKATQLDGCRIHLDFSGLRFHRDPWRSLLIMSRNLRELAANIDDRHKEVKQALILDLIRFVQSVQQDYKDTVDKRKDFSPDDVAENLANSLSGQPVLMESPEIRSFVNAALKN